MSKEINKKNRREKKELLPSDFYMEGTRKVFTEEWHKKRGYCCGSGCRHCPFIPKHHRGITTTNEK